MEVRRFETRDWDAALALAADAFMGGALYRSLIPEDSARLSFLRGIFQCRFKVGVKKGEIYVVDAGEGKLAGFASWILPGLVPTHEDWAESGMEEFFAATPPEIAKGWHDVSELMGGLQKKYIEKPVWFLAPIAVSPDMWGKGVASLLMRSQLKKIDAKGDPCFLITQDEKNIPIYRRYGFEVDGSDSYGGVTHWAMTRELP